MYDEGQQKIIYQRTIKDINRTIDRIVKKYVMREYKSRITSGTASLIVNILFLVADKLPI